MSKITSISQIDIEMACLAGFFQYCGINLKNVKEELEDLKEEEIQELDKLAEIADKTLAENTNEAFQNALTEYIRSIIQRSKE